MKQILLKRYFGFKAVFRILIFTVTKLWQCLCFLGNPQQQVLFPIYKNLFIKKKDPPQMKRVSFLNKYVKNQLIHGAGFGPKGPRTSPSGVSIV